MSSYADALITSAHHILNDRLDYNDREKATILVAEAQAQATTAVAAALDRLAEAVENLDFSTR